MIKNHFRRPLRRRPALLALKLFRVGVETTSTAAAGGGGVPASEDTAGDVMFHFEGFGSLALG